MILCSSFIIIKIETKYGETELDELLEYNSTLLFLHLSNVRKFSDD